jgi:ankyrin repeat protein
MMCLGQSLTICSAVLCSVVAMSEGEMKDEELHVLFHAAKLGRTDIIQHAVATLKAKKDASVEVADVLSSPNEEGGTALHVAAFNGHADAVRALLVLPRTHSLIHFHTLLHTLLHTHCTHALTISRTHNITHSLTRSLAHSLTYALYRTF